MPASILICEDDEQMRRLIATVVRGEGRLLREAGDGHAALDALAEEPADLVILDLHMPGPGGLEVLDHIRGDPALAHTRVLLLSGKTEALDGGWHERVGADAHLPKPFAVGDLRASVQDLLSGS